MALATLVIDPAATALTDDQHVDAINAASNQITRASSVASAARPIAALEVTNSELSLTAAQDNLEALTDVDRKYIRTLPISGQFKIINMHRRADGKLDVVYDDVAVV